MNKNKLKAYAPAARLAFIQAATDRAHFWGLSEKGAEPIEEKGDVTIIGGRPFPRQVASQRRKLEERVKREGFNQVMEAAAYTWFNRFLALRYMELHGYLEHGFRVLSNANGGTIPEILDHATQVELPGLDRQRVVELKLDGGKDAELYRMLLVAQCHALHNAMPFLFEKIDDETELLLPDNLLHSDSLLRKLVTDIDVADWQEVEIIGWLYQFYISDKKDQVIGKVVKSEDIPAATQLFTPNWIVKYMVQNSLGRMWLATYPESPLRQKMEYYIEPAEQTDDVKAQLKAITPASLNPESLSFLDPANGSGHILVEAYDIFKEIYLERGYSSRDFPRLILEKNLYGLDIDDRAAQMAGFALLMKARKDDRRILQNGNVPRLNVMAIQGSEGLDAQEFARNLLDRTTTEIGKQDITELVELFRHGKTFGSLITVPEGLAGKLSILSEVINAKLQSGDMFAQQGAETILPFVEQAKILARKYDCVVANPPYMSGGYLTPLLKQYLKDNYRTYEKDLFSTFMIRNIALTQESGQLGFMSPFVWMFISSYEELRQHFIDYSTITSLVQLEYSGFDGATVPVCTFTIGKKHISNFSGSFIRLSDFKGSDQQGPRTLEAIRKQECGWFYVAKPDDFMKIPGSPIAYWVSKRVGDIFQELKPVSDYFSVNPGIRTGKDELFLRLWFEIERNNIQFELFDASQMISQNRWFPLHKGGNFRKWYGNAEHVIDLHQDGIQIKTKSPDFRLRDKKWYFQPFVSWSRISSASIAFRYFAKGVLFSDAGPGIFAKEQCLQVMALLNSKLGNYFLKIINPTLNYQKQDIETVPYVCFENNGNVDRAVHLEKLDWDSYETSWDFINHPLLQPEYVQSTLKGTLTKLRAHWREITIEMQRLEEKNNRIFIEAYGLQEELTPDVPLNEITLTCNPHYRYSGNKNEVELEALLHVDTLKEFISYTIGCMMGRYSPDRPGLVYANSGNEGFDASKYESFPADDDGIIPVVDMDWFPDDVAGRFEEFLKVAWSPETLAENLKFVADSLSPKGGESPRETIRRYISTQFFKDHLQTYKKRPIYWLFSSGKQRAFECLVYLHRFNEGTLSRMRNEYVTPLQGKLTARMDYLANEIDAAATTSARSKLQKQLEVLKKKQAELAAFDDLLRHYADQRISLDLDDGVKVNYGKFGNLLAEVKSITGTDE